MSAHPAFHLRTIAVITIASVCLVASGAAQQQYVITIPTSLGDTTETFWLQIPSGYQEGSPAPLLIGWHQLGGSYTELRDATDFDGEADRRGWIVAAPAGPTPTHWTNQAAQSHVVDVISWISISYDVDPDRIYMVGASMGGAAGMVFSNNHLDPSGPMIAAAASISGIQDCDRRFHEQGYNNSMVGAFGGTPDEVPFAYHRNSAIYFADSARSMHINAIHLPLYLTFGAGESDLVWRRHAEDLYAVMSAIADTVVLRESDFSGHGWACTEERRICDFFEPFRAVRCPERISINADESGRWYWAEIETRMSGEPFGRFDGAVDAAQARVEVAMNANVATAILDLAPLGFPVTGPRIECEWSMDEPDPSKLGFAGVLSPPAAVLRDGVLDTSWDYDADRGILSLFSDAGGRYLILFDAAGFDDGRTDPEREPFAPLRAWVLPNGEIRVDQIADGVLSWQFIDPSGRRLASGRDWRSAGSGEIAPPGRIGSGVSFLVLELEGSAHRDAVRLVRAGRFSD